MLITKLKHRNLNYYLKFQRKKVFQSIKQTDRRRTRRRYRASIEIQHAHFEGQAASGQGPSGRGDSDDAENEAAAAAHAAAERLNGAEPAGGGERVAGEEVRAA